MSNPYRLDEPFVVSFSGGRTSAFMLWQILQAFGGALPAGGKAVFCNTGKERPETLDFVERCSQRWGVEVTWLEYRFTPAPEGGKARGGNATKGTHGFVLVDYATASREGEPFVQVIQARSLLPNPVMRFCTAELKIRTTYRYLRSLGWEEWDNAVGLRHDEPRRVVRARNPEPKSRQPGESVVCPLYDAGVTLADVTAFWAGQSFDLALQAHEGNCDLCFLKGRDRIALILRDRPELAAWWVAQEAAAVGKIKSPGSARFRADRPSYAQMLKQVQEQPLLEWGDEPLADCHCTD